MLSTACVAPRFDQPAPVPAQEAVPGAGEGEGKSMEPNPEEEICYRSFLLRCWAGRAAEEHKRSNVSHTA